MQSSGISEKIDIINDIAISKKSFLYSKAVSRPGVGRWTYVGLLDTSSESIFYSFAVSASTFQPFWHIHLAFLHGHDFWHDL